ncbi:Mde2 protein [Schizosaccharomyces japonicus yFS275]|uniref:Mde2 protein n=1 Tax=Schizosaccharomyces japonicus (strain yFS275 / FY16936) TaxID=402676 RepID=B6JWY3_SCHJY|nr:Mde2 protein [Schizosaccharomyces japonicus yFS275]EEB05884.1 Mde2 protein [Schizosaccharomyces japonicus yFS275]
MFELYSPSYVSSPVYSTPAGDESSSKFFVQRKLNSAFDELAANQHVQLSQGQKRPSAAVKKVRRCGLCHEAGHNRTYCPHREQANPSSSSQHRPPVASDLSIDRWVVRNENSQASQPLAASQLFSLQQANVVDNSAENVWSAANGNPPSDPGSLPSITSSFILPPVPLYDSSGVQGTDLLHFNLGPSDPVLEAPPASQSITTNSSCENGQNTCVSTPKTSAVPSYTRRGPSEKVMVHFDDEDSAEFEYIFGSTQTFSSSTHKGGKGSNSKRLCFTRSQLREEYDCLLALLQPDYTPRNAQERERCLHLLNGILCR